MNNNGTYVELEFGSAVTFDRFVLVTRNNTADSVNSNRLYISSSPTHSLSDTIVSFSTAGNNGQGIIQKFSPVTGRYVRWEVLGASASTANVGGNMMQFLATPAGMVQLSAVVINSSTPYNAGFAASHAVDGYAGLNNSDGAFASLGAGASMFIDFDLGAFFRSLMLRDTRKVQGSVQTVGLPPATGSRPPFRILDIAAGTVLFV